MKVEIQELLVELDETEPIRNLTSATEGKQRHRENRISGKLRLDHLNDDENRVVYQDYKDILSSTVVTRHSMCVQPGTNSINTRL
jgi:hypothetical protein